MLVSLPIGRLLLPESRGDRRRPLGRGRRADGRRRAVRPGPRRQAARRRRGAAEPAHAGAAARSAGCCSPCSSGASGGARIRWWTCGCSPGPAFSTSVGCIVLAMLALVGPGADRRAVPPARARPVPAGDRPAAAAADLRRDGRGPRGRAACCAGSARARWSASASASPRRPSVLLTAMGEHDNTGLLLAGFVLLGFGLETTLFGAYESMLSEAPPEQAGGAAAIGETSYQLGAGIGIALLGSVMNAAYAPGLSLRARASPPPARRGGRAFAGRGVRGRRTARRAGRGGPAAGRPGLLRARAACDAAGQRGAAAARRGDGAAAAAGHGLRCPDRRSRGAAGRRGVRPRRRDGAAACPLAGTP